ncbi:hypothetical protein SAMN05443248_5423 [Bradyrhizobium erythrophlei]|uniref:Uncharacterized protein n=1 Tax=Bradyrhizobium erythrophlei TaxID=1437360 RepID=A0A1M5UFY2_9BRAD|nr:hypothetical protein SAMN05443248_5423 [Bradyrhizobium erythrophlei]
MGSLADIELQRREPPHISNPPATMAGVYLCRRSCINPVIADVVASLAGLGPNQRAA